MPEPRPSRSRARSDGRARRASADHRGTDGLPRLRGGRAARRTPGAGIPVGARAADRADGDRSRGGVRPLAATAHPGRTRARRPLRRRRGGRRGPGRAGVERRASVARPGRRPRRGARRGRVQHGGRGLPMDRLGLQGAHPGRGHLPRGALPPGLVPGSRRWLPDLPATARDEPRALHVLRSHAGHGAGRLVAGTAGAGGGATRLHPADRGNPPTRADRDARPTAGARAPRRPQGAGRARDAGRSRPQRYRPGLRGRDRFAPPS